MLGIGSDVSGFAEHTDDQIDDVTTNFKHDPATELGQFTTACGIDHFAHHRVAFKDVAQPAAFQKISQQHDGGVIAIHVTHL